jgi:pimeloyl-ACP methyl ester carboxylesterase
MLPVELKGTQGPLLVMLHWLGGSGRTWVEVSDGLVGMGAWCAALDLPGFGAAKDATDFSVPTMVEEVIATVQSMRRSHPDTPWLLVGHSMGGKIAALVARQAEEGREGLNNLAGMVLISPSPADPEPMDESKRTELLATLAKRGNAADDRAHAEKFIDDNTGKLALAPAVRAQAVEEVLRSSGAAFEAWLTTGSKEDCSQRVGVLTLPALCLAGTEDAALGPEAQRTHTLPHFAHAQLVALEGGGHLAPLERAGEVVERIAMFMEGLGLPVQRNRGLLGATFRALIESNDTAPQTRAVMEARLQEGHSSLRADQILMLRALCHRVAPGCAFDLASRIDGWLKQGKHDGWRNDRLPPVVEAWRQGLLSLDAAATRAHGVPFVALRGAQQDALLANAQKGELASGSLDATQMQAWFEDVRGEVAKLYIADPRTMERIGFTGFADEQGFTQIRLGELEEFER